MWSALRQRCNVALHLSAKVDSVAAEMQCSVALVCQQRWTGRDANEIRIFQLYQWRQSCGPVSHLSANVGEAAAEMQCSMYCYGQQMRTDRDLSDNLSFQLSQRRQSCDPVSHMSVNVDGVATEMQCSIAPVSKGGHALRQRCNVALHL